MARKAKTKSAPERDAKEAAKGRSSSRPDRRTGGDNKDPRALRFEQDLWRNLDRLNQVVAKSIDLAEASIVLGVRMVSGLGKIGHEQILNRVVETAGAQQQADEHPVGSPEPSAPIPGVTNRSLLHPGSEVYLSFSLTNDSSAAAKTVRVSLERLIGEVKGARMTAEALRVTPPEGRLAPLDFEKFVITGRIPSETVPDTYVGAILVEGDERLAIPLRLAVI